MSVIPEELDKNKDTMHVVRGVEDVFALVAYCTSSAQKTIDFFSEEVGVYYMLHSSETLKMHKEALDRGVRIRVITQITKENLPSVKEGMRYISDIRHMDTIAHTFGVSEKHYLSSKLQYGDPQLTQSIFSNIGWFVREQQYLFETLWKKAIPLKQRAKEIEEGRKREFVDTIRDPKEIVSLLPHLISSAYEEVKLLFPSSQAFRNFDSSAGITESTRKHRQQNRSLNVKLLLKEEGREEENIIRCDHKGRDHQQRLSDSLRYKSDLINEEDKYVEVKFGGMYDMDPRSAFVIVDDDKILAIELEEGDDPSTDILDSMRFATYSNSESLLMSHASIFEKIWIQSEMKQQREERRH